MVIVLGLITIMIGLLLTVTVSVYNGIKSGADFNAIVKKHLGL